MQILGMMYGPSSGDDSPCLQCVGFSVHRGAVFSIHSPKAPSESQNSVLTDPSPLQNVLRRIDVPVASHSASRALPRAVRRASSHLGSYSGDRSARPDDRPW